MASSSGPSETSSQQPPLAQAEAKPGSRFERITDRLRGTVTILGDVVNTDPAFWTCERE